MIPSRTYIYSQLSSIWTPTNYWMILIIMGSIGIRLKQILLVIFRRLQFVPILSPPLRFLRVFGRQLWCLLRFFSSSRQNRPGIACASVHVPVPPSTIPQQNPTSQLTSSSMSNSTSLTYVPNLALRQTLVPCTVEDVRRYKERESV